MADDSAALRDEVRRLRGELEDLRAAILGARSPRRRRRRHLAVGGFALGLAGSTALAEVIQRPQPSYVTAQQVNDILVSLVTAQRTIGSYKAFEVKGQDGKVIFSVDQNRLQWNGTSGQPLLVIEAAGDAGRLALRSSDGKVRAEIGNGARGNMALRVLNRQNLQVAGFGEDPDNTGAGALKIHTAAGRIVAGVTTVGGQGHMTIFDAIGGKGIAEMGAEQDGRAYVTVYNPSGISVAALAISDKIKNVGRITVNDAAGNGVFSAGWVGDGGAACLNGKGGRLWCLGKNLPLGK